MRDHPSTAGADPRRLPPRAAVAFLARVSTDDQQDPTLSLPRQLASCQAALPQGWEITAWFWDIESGRTALERRGRGPRRAAIGRAARRFGRPDDVDQSGAAHPGPGGGHTDRAGCG
ncbi:MAG TPA: recombinase family protein [Micromonosporaceae bacterium]|nr:recombinase family protein [Micromonosporaceae bacterium]